MIDFSVSLRIIIEKMSRKAKKTSNASNKTNFSTSNSTLWPQWSDDKINTEKWSASKGSANEFFEDPNAPILPASLKPHSWKRPHQINDTEPVLYVSSSKLPNLFINNQHIFHCQFTKWFISSLTTLYYHGREGLRVAESPNFTWKLGNKPWRGWYYIYSLNKIDRKSQHNPLINPHGKYIVRLFFCGTWRSIEVDDLIPLDNDNNPLLPRTENNQELWPIILAKAMLKIISSAWKSSEDVDQKEINQPINVNLIYLLTGWTCLSLDVSHVYPNDRWDLLLKYVTASTDSDILKDDSLSEGSDRTSRDSVVDTNRSKRNGRGSKGSSASIKTLKKKKKKDEEVNDSKVLTLVVFKNNEENIIPSYYPIYTELVSGISLDPDQAKSPLENWKRHRWFCWASQQGIMNPIDYTTPSRLILLFTSFLYHQRQSQFSLHDNGKNSNQLFTWFDFNELSKYSMEIIFLFKTERFKYSINISDVIEMNLSHPNNDKQLFQNYYQYSHQPVERNYQNTRFRNEPLYFLIDLLEPECIIFNLNIFPGDDKASVLIVEKHSWLKRTLDEKPLLKIRTRTSSSKILSLGSGRHLLKIFIKSPNSYHLTIQSDTKFEVGNREKIQESMTLVSETSKIYTEKIKKYLISAFDAFGSDNYRERLKAFYQSYLPECKPPTNCENFYKDEKKVSLMMHKLFKRALINFVKRRFLGDDLEHILQSLRIFFIDPSIRQDYRSYSPDEMVDDDPYDSTYTFSMKNLYKYIYYNDYLSLDFANESAKVKAAIVIQSFWRMSRVQFYWKIHTLESNEGKREEIKKYMDLLGLMLNRGLIYDLVRDFLRKSDDLNDLYPIRNDFPHILNITKLQGKVSSFTNKLLPIFCLIVSVPKSCTVFASFNLFIDLPITELRAFNNDNHREVQRFINRIIPFHYDANYNGYTIACYGWMNDHDDGGDHHTSVDRRKSFISQQKEIPWTLQIATLKGDPEFIFVDINGRNESIPSFVDVPNLMMKEISNNYIPNMSDIIFRLVVKTSRSCSMTLRVTVTFKKLFINIKLLNSQKKIIETFLTHSGVIVPVIHFDKSDLFYIETEIRKNSWRLTDEEWKTVADIKEKKSYRYRSLKKKNNATGTSVKNSDSKKVMMNDGEKGVLEAPYWTVQAIISGDDALEIYEDTSDELKMMDLKESWFADDPERLAKGEAIRKEFVKKYDSTKKKKKVICVDMLEENERVIELY